MVLALSVGPETPKKLEKMITFSAVPSMTVIEVPPPNYLGGNFDARPHEKQDRKLITSLVHIPTQTPPCSRKRER